MTELRLQYWHLSSGMHVLSDCFLQIFSALLNISSGDRAVASPPVRGFCGLSAGSSMTSFGSCNNFSGSIFSFTVTVMIN